MNDTLLTLGDLEAFTTHKSLVGIRAKHLATDLGLEEEFKHFLNYNKAAGLCYHNRYHSTWMMVQCSEMGQAEDLDEESLRTLVLAAMFHDFNHSGGIVSDRVNVDNAVIGLSLARSEKNGNLFVKAAELIAVTEFPFVHKPTTVEQKILRDADILQGCTVHFQKTIYTDLFSELLVSKPGLTLIEFRKGQEEFLRGVELFTKQGQAEHQEFLETLAPLFWRKFDKWAS